MTTAPTILGVESFTFDVHEHVENMLKRLQLMLRTLAECAEWTHRDVDKKAEAVLIAKKNAQLAKDRKRVEVPPDEVNQKWMATTPSTKRMCWAVACTRCRRARCASCA